MVTVVESLVEVGPVLPASSVTELAANRAITVPSCGHDTETVTVVADVVTGVKVQTPAVPTFKKSDPTRPLNDSLTVIEKSNDRAFTIDAADVNELTLGAV
jgi:hypothetical protein